MATTRKGVNLGELNGQWKGDKVGYGALHSWVKSRLGKPDVCENCHLKKPQDLSNRSGKYLRDLGDWEWLCRTCHMIKDGRMYKLHHDRIGKKLSKEWRKNIGLASKGHVLSEEAKRKIGLANKGHLVSERVRKIISECQKARQARIRRCSSML